jgi:putative glycosyltransferase (TIGR04372 family)
MGLRPLLTKRTEKVRRIMFNKHVWGRFQRVLKDKDSAAISRALGYVIFRFLGLLFALPTILILWVLKPIVWLKVGKLPCDRLGALALNTDLFLRRRQLGIYPDGPHYCFVCTPHKLSNRQLLTMWKRIIPIYESRILCWIYDGMLTILKRSPFQQDLPMNSNEYYEFNNSKSSIVFQPDEIEKGNRILEQMGVDFKKVEFVCIFARDDAYLKNFDPFFNWDYQKARNADIDNLVETAKYLIEKGFVVIRVGSIVNKPINFSHKKMIDYPYTEHHSDFMDIFLLANCKFVISSGCSGLTDVAAISDKPMLTVNIGEFGYAPITKNRLYIPKKYKYINTNNYLHFKDAVNLGVFWYNPAALGLEAEENCPQEILEATKEMLDRLENRFIHFPESESLMQAYHKVRNGSGTYASPNKTPIGNAWLKKNQDLFF